MLMKFSEFVAQRLNEAHTPYQAMDKYRKHSGTSWRLRKSREDWKKKFGDDVVVRDGKTNQTLDHRIKRHDQAKHAALRVAKKEAKKLKRED